MLHKHILEWQARHPTIWGVIWTIVLITLSWPNPAHGV